MRTLEPLLLPLQGQILIEASAGTGKTWSIALLYLRLLLERQRTVDEILIVTFTRAATAELRERVRKRIREALNELEQAGVTGDGALRELLDRQADTRRARQRLEDALVRMDEAAIFTIHGFCQRMLQEHAFASGSPFEMEFIESEGLMRQRIIEDFWRKHFNRCNREQADWLVTRWQTPSNLLAKLKGHLSRPEVRCIPDIGPEDIEAQHAELETVYPQLCRHWLENREQIIALIDSAIADKYLSVSKSTGYAPHHLARAFADMDQLAASDRPPFSLPQGHMLALLTRGKLSDSLTQKGQGHLPEHPFFSEFEAFLGAVEQLQGQRAMLLLLEARRYLFTELEKRKKQRAQLYFNDLLIQLDAALSGVDGARLARQIARRYPAILVDEFQDTDPLQYAIFRRIFLAHQAIDEADRETSMVLIGDPKQAIYAFRGADIFTYMAAARDTARESRFTLDTNYRSIPQMVSAVNRLFDREAPFLFGRIAYQQISASTLHANQQFQLNEQVQAPMNCLLLQGDDSRPLSKQDATRDAARRNARQIAELLLAGGKGRASLAGNPLQPRDIAVLVRTHDEASLMRQQLAELGISSVYSGRESVYASAQAEQLVLFLGSLLNSADEGRLRSALATDLVGYDAQRLDRLQRDERAWEKCREKLDNYRLAWQQQGFSTMFNALLAKEDVVTRLLCTVHGERKLTNFTHLAERLQAAEPQTQGPEGLLRWLREQVQSPEIDSEEQQLRLESDENLVRIVTIHRSKGLEYPLVFLPFLWSARSCKQDDLLAFHHPDEPEILRVDLGTGLDEHFELAERERLAEDRRLLYVALTRAKYACYFSWGLVNKMQESALFGLLHETDSPTPEQIMADLKARLGKLPNELRFITADDQAKHPAPTRPSPGDQLQSKQFSGSINRQALVISYSNLVADAEASAEKPDRDQLVLLPEGIQHSDDIFGFPRGAKAGICLHGILEKIDFIRASDGTTDDDREIIRQHLSRAGIAASWEVVIEQWLSRFLCTPIRTDFSLSQLERTDRLDEMDFYFSLDSLRWRDFNQILKQFGYAPIDRQGVLTGLMRGFIDLVYRHHGRFYLADYKSNHLGNQAGDYRADKLALTMQQHRYDLQYLIYTIALHRYLGTRIPDYHYETHFGGVDYLFLRGMHPEHPLGNGVYHQRPPLELITALDHCSREVLA